MSNNIIDILEFCAQDGIGVEAEQPILRNVKILGGVSKNRRRYLPEAIAQAAPLYEGLPVNIDHAPRSGAAGRGLRERFGKLVNVRSEAGTLRGDLHYNPKHPLAEAVRWWADHQPDAIGLSHNATGSGHTDSEGIYVVDKIVSVRCVDVVADPATTRGLYEADMTHDANQHPELQQPVVGNELTEEERAAVAALRESADPHVQCLLETVERQRHEHERRAQVRELVERAKLPAFAVTDVFLDLVARAASEAEMRSLIEDRRQLFERASIRKPRSLGVSPTALGAREFAQAVKQV